MAVAFVTSGFWDATFNAAGDVHDNAFDSGTGSDRILIVPVTWNDSAAHDNIDDVQYNAVSLTAFAATLDQANCKQRAFHQVAPPTGSNTLRVDPDAGAGTAAACIGALVYSGVDQSTPYDGYTSASGQDTASPLTSQVTITSASGDHAVTWHGGEFSTGATAISASGFTERYENHSGTVSQIGGDEPGAASVATTATWTVGFGNLDWIAEGCNLNAAAAGTTYTASLAGATGPVGALTKQTARTLTAAIAPGAALLKMTSRSLAGAIASAGDLVREIRRALAGALSPSGALATTKVALLAITAAIAPAGALVRQTGKALVGAQTATGTLTRSIARQLVGAVAPAGAVTKIIARAFGGALSFAGSLVATIADVITRTAQKRRITLSAGDIRNTGITPTARRTSITPGTRNTGITPDD